MSVLALTFGRTITAPPSILVLVLMVSPIWTLLLGLVAAAMAWWRPLDARVWACLVIQLALWSFIWGRAWWASPVATSGDTVRVMAWNVQRLGFEDSDEGERLSCVVEAVREAQADLVSFMEVSARDLAALPTALGLSCEHVD